MKVKAREHEPFELETIRLRRPIPAKDGGEIAEITLRPPELRDALAADGRPGAGFAIALLASLTGVPERSLARMIPEDVAEVGASLLRASRRFTGDLSLVPAPEGAEPGDGPADPFADEVIQLRRPLRSGEAEVAEITLRPPEFRDLLFADGRPEDSLAHSVAQLSSRTGVPEKLLGRMIPEDWADVARRLGRTHLRYIGELNLVDGEADVGDPPPAEADTQPPTSAAT